MRCPHCDNDLTPTSDGSTWCTQCAENPPLRKAPSEVSPRPAAAPAPAFAAGGAAAARQRHLPPFVLPFAAVVLLGLFALVFGSDGDDEPEAVDPAPAAAESAPTPDAAPTPVSARRSGRIARQLDAEVPARNDIERARNATVFIKTPTSVGSGFFLGSGCRILSNRHVVALGSGDADAMQAQLREAERQLVEVNRWLDAKKENFRRRCRDCSEDAWERYVGRDIDRVREAEGQVEDRRQQILGLRHGSQLTAVLADGSEHSLEIVQLSDQYDLALLEIPESGCPAMETASSSDLQLGQQLFTIGSPRGLRHKVTSGIFSGYVGDSGDPEDFRVLQTDAPINPGNSGGPLVDDRGRVVGINSAILRDSEGIGLAIPIELALSQFERQLGRMR